MRRTRQLDRYKEVGVSHNIFGQRRGRKGLGGCSPVLCTFTVSRTRLLRIGPGQELAESAFRTMWGPVLPGSLD